MRRFVVLLVIPALIGCRFNNTATEVSIDDLSSDRFRIATVDGKPAKRFQHPLTTTKPFVLVEPGPHTFTIDGSSKSFTAELAPGKNYETRLLDGVPTIVEVIPSDTGQNMADRPIEH